MHNFSNRNLTIITSVIKTVSNPLYDNCILKQLSNIIDKNMHK